MGQQTPRLSTAPGAELPQRHNSDTEASLFPALAVQLLRLLPSAGTASTAQPRALRLHLLLPPVLTSLLPLKFETPFSLTTIAAYIQIKL